MLFLCQEKGEIMGMRKYKTAYALMSVTRKINYNGQNVDQVYAKVVVPCFIINENAKKSVCVNGVSKTKRAIEVLYMWKQDGSLYKNPEFDENGKCIGSVLKLRTEVKSKQEVFYDLEYALAESRKRNDELLQDYVSMYRGAYAQGLGEELIKLQEEARCYASSMRSVVLNENNNYEDHTK